MKLTSASIIIASAIGLCINGVTGRPELPSEGLCFGQESGGVYRKTDSGGRQLGNETDTAKPISGHVFRLILPDDNTNEIAEHHMAHNVTG